VDDEGIGVDHVDRALGHLGAVPGLELGCAEIREDRNVGRRRTQGAPEPGGAVALERDPLRADAEGKAEFTASLGDMLVKGLSLLRPAGHRTDQKWSAQAPREERRRQIHRIEIDLW
jgi:hypothetical protein